MDLQAIRDMENYKIKRPDIAQACINFMKQYPWYQYQYPWFSGHGTREQLFSLLLTRNYCLKLEKVLLKSCLTLTLKKILVKIVRVQKSKYFKSAIVGVDMCCDMCCDMCESVLV